MKILWMRCLDGVVVDGDNGDVVGDITHAFALSTHLTFDICPIITILLTSDG